MKSLMLLGSIPMTLVSRLILVDFRHMSQTDIKLSMLSGGTNWYENLEIKPYTLREIRDYGYSNYMANIQWLSLTMDDFITSVQDEEKREYLEEQKDSLRAFDFHIKLGGRESQQSLVTALAMVFRTNDLRILSDGVVAIDFIKLGVFKKDEDGQEIVDDEALDLAPDDAIKIIHRDNFDDIVNIIKYQNYMEKPQALENKENPVDDETRKLQEQMKKLREKVESIKNADKNDEDESDTDLADIISAVSVKSNSINKLNIWDFTLYQVYDEYARLELIDNYDFSLKAMMAGADIKEKIRHWSSSI